MIRCLSFHAAYRCRHAGACCRAGWTIPFDAREASRVRNLDISHGGLMELAKDVTIARRTDSGCSFFESDTSLCAIHRVGGHESLPVSCRMFPRSVLIDARGTFVSLSHFCPTAAALLFEPGPRAAIVEAPATLLDVGPLDGLDARSAWPPLLRPGVLMDLESYDAWEQFGVELVTREGVAPDAALAALEHVAARIASWTAEEGPLLDYVRDTFRATPPQRGILAPHDVAVKRWLAARLFACWIAYQKDGIADIARYLRSCLETFAEGLGRLDNALEAIRRADLQIMHTEPDLHQQ